MTQKDKIVVGLKNQNANLITKIEKFKGKYEKILQHSKVASDKLKKKIEYLKAQSSEKKKKAQKLEGDIQNLTVAFHNVNNDNVMLLQIMNNFQNLLDQVAEKMISLAHLHQSKE